jgi:hypothetical protein
VNYAVQLIQEGLEEINAGETRLAIISLQGATRILELQLKPQPQGTEPLAPSPEPPSSFSEATSALTDAYLQVVNELTQDPRTTAMGAHSLGVVTVEALRAGMVPDRDLCERASRLQTPAEAMRLVEEWIGERSMAGNPRRFI